VTGTSELDRFPDLCNLSPNTVNSSNTIGTRRNFLLPDLIGKAVNGANAWKKIIHQTTVATQFGKPNKFPDVWCIRSCVQPMKNSAISEIIFH